MRKWMRDRLDRRKKKPAEPGNQPAAPPLQPAYFDADQTPTSAVESTHHDAESPAASDATFEAQPANPQSAHQESQSEGAEAVRPTKGPAGEAQRSRGRRRRGGRGRGGRGREQAVAEAFTPAAAKGNVPGAPTDPIADEASSREGSAQEASFAEASPADESPESARSDQSPVATPLEARPASPANKLPAAVPTAPPRPPKGIVVLAIGLPGSGKSSWFKRHNVVPLSTDMVRSLLFDDVREQRFQDLVFSNLRSMLKARLIAKRPMNYVDATNLTPQERQHWIKLAKDYNYEVHAIFFDVPLEVCVERHQRRDRVVPEDVLRRMAAKLKPPAFSEGFAKITVVRVKKKDDTQPET
jgi:predicted kinase